LPASKKVPKLIPAVRLELLLQLARLFELAMVAESI
jgi:hypothetical protein